MNGNSQAVRIPAAFRLEAEEVEVSKNEAGDLVIREVKKRTVKRGDALVRALARVDREFVQALDSNRAKRLPVQDRGAL